MERQICKLLPSLPLVTRCKILWFGYISKIISAVRSGILKKTLCSYFVFKKPCLRCFQLFQNIFYSIYQKDVYTITQACKKCLSRQIFVTKFRVSQVNRNTDFFWPNLGKRNSQLIYKISTRSVFTHTKSDTGYFGNSANRNLWSGMDSLLFISLKTIDFINTWAFIFRSLTYMTTQN